MYKCVYQSFCRPDLVNLLLIMASWFTITVDFITFFVLTNKCYYYAIYFIQSNVHIILFIFTGIQLGGGSGCKHPRWLCLSSFLTLPLKSWVKVKVLKMRLAPPTEIVLPLSLSRFHSLSASLSLSLFVSLSLSLSHTHIHTFTQSFSLSS